MAPFAFVAVLLSGLAVLQLTSAGTLEEKKSFFAKFHPSIVFNPAVYDLPYSYGPRANESGVGDEQTDLYLIMYHKTGTVLARNLAAEIANVLDDTTTVTAFQIYGNMQKMAYNVTSDQKRARAVVFIRDPVKFVESAYLYHKSHPGDSRGTHPETWTSFENGLETEAKHDRMWIRRMKEMESKVKDLDNVKIIWTDDIGHSDEQYECFVDLIVDFLIGDNLISVDDEGDAITTDEATELARRAVRRFSPSRRSSQAKKHIHSSDEHDEVHAKLEAMRESNDHVREIFNPDYKLNESVSALRSCVSKFETSD